MGHLLTHGHPVMGQQQPQPLGDGKRKRRRRRRGGRGRGQQENNGAVHAKENGALTANESSENEDGEDNEDELPSEGEAESNGAPRQAQSTPQSEEEGAQRRRRRRRGRRGRRRDGDSPRVELGQENGIGIALETHADHDGEMRVQGTGPIAEQSDSVTVVETPQWLPPEPLPAFTSHVVPEPPAPVAKAEEIPVAEDSPRAPVQDLRRPEPAAAAPDPAERKGGWWQRRFEG
jgi:ribonuclease E